MTLPKAAAEYEAESRHALYEAAGKSLNGKHEDAAYLCLSAIAEAILTLAAATLEAAALVGPTPEDQRRLDELMPRPSAYCCREWSADEATVRGRSNHLHRCVHAAGHEREEPHYCQCGSEL